MNLKFVTLENNINYMIISEANYNNIKYLLLVNENDKDDYCIRKVITENEQEFITALESEQEFNIAVKLFNDKWKY